MTTSDWAGAAILAVLILSPLVIGLVVTALMDWWQQRQQCDTPARVTFLDQVDALALRRYRKHEAVKQLRAAARSARRRSTRPTNTDNTWR
jgi:hypothetical protein